MILIETVDTKYFTLDGVKFARIYQPLKQGSEAIGIYSIYDTKLQLLNSTNYSEFQINGSGYASQEATISALLAVIWAGSSEYQIEQLEWRVDNLEENQVTGVEVYSTYADLPATGTLLVSYKVSNDTDSSLNGFYHWSGSAYVKDAELNEETVKDVERNKQRFNSQFALPLDEVSNFDSADFTEGGYFASDGSIGTVGGSTYSYQSNYVRVEENVPFKYTGSLVDLRYIVFYDKDKNVIGSTYAGSGTNLTHEFTTPSSCKFLRCSCTTSALGTFKVEYNGTEPLELFAQKSVETDVTSLQEDVADLILKQILVDSLVTDSPSITTGAYLSSSGVVTAFAGSYYTDFIPVTKKRAYLLRTNCQDLRAICIYNSSQEFIEGWTGDSLGHDDLYSGGYFKAVLIMPSDAAYIRISGASVSYLPSVWALTLNSYQLLSQLQGIQTNTSGIAENVSSIDILTAMFGYETFQTLLDNVSLSAGYINGSGTVSTGFAGDYHTDYIPVEGSKYYRYKGNFTDARAYAEYDESYNFIKAVSASSIGTPVTDYQFKTDADTRFVRFSVYMTTPSYSLAEVAKNIKFYIDEILENVVINDTDYSYLAPETIFGTDNDADSGNFFNREYLVRLYPESFIRSQLPIKVNGKRSMSIQSTSKNTATKETDSINFELSGSGYLTKTDSFDYIRTKSSNAKSKSMRLLCIGDSITALNLKQTDGQYVGGWAYPSITKELSMKDNIDHADDLIQLLMIGTKNDQDGRTFDYNGSNYSVRSFSEGQGSRTAASFLRHATHLTANGTSSHTPEAAWQMLGLTTSEGHEFTGSDADKNLIMTTVQKDNWDYGEAIYLDMVDSGGTYIGDAAQLAEIDAAMTALLNSPDIPFYDLTTANSGIGYSFNIQAYLDRYKTLNDSDGETRLIVGSTAGSKVTDANEYDVCTPTHIIVELGENDRWWYAPTASDIRDTLEAIAAAIHATHSGIKVAFVNTRMLGSYYPEEWQDKGFFRTMSVSSNYIKYDVQELLKTDLGNLATQVANKIYLLPTYHTMSINSFSLTKQVVDLMDLETVYSGNTDINHPGIAASSDIAYQILSWIYYTL